MSLIKVQKLEDNYRRDSFDNRFIGDDLTEVMLQFLPIKDKFRFECVSKQFQRTVFQRHYELIITEVMRQKDLTFETIVKKLAHIKSLKSKVKLNKQDLNSIIISRVDLNYDEIKVIIKNCNHLTEFNIDLRLVWSQLWTHSDFCRVFDPRFGQRLTAISVFDIKPKFINSLINIQEINFYSNFVESKYLIDFYSQFKPKCLKKISLKFRLFPSELLQFSDIQTKYFKIFIENNKSITHLSLRIDGKELSKLYNNYPFDVSLGCISHLNQLISLKIEINIRSEALFESLKRDIRQIAVNCLKLKSLSLSFDYYFTSDWFKSDLMSEIKRFKGLKRFEFNFNHYLGYLRQFENHLIDSLKTGFEYLTHLTLDLCYYLSNENCLQNIVIYLPKLQKLIIKNPIEATERTADIVSRLSKLQTLELNIKTKRNQKILSHFIQSFNETLREKCRKIKSIELQTPITQRAP